MLFLVVDHQNHISTTMNSMLFLMIIIPGRGIGKKALVVPLSPQICLVLNPLPAMVSCSHAWCHALGLFSQCALVQLSCLHAQ